MPLLATLHHHSLNNHPPNCPFTSCENSVLNTQVWILIYIYFSRWYGSKKFHMYIYTVSAWLISNEINVHHLYKKVDVSIKLGLHGNLLIAWWIIGLSTTIASMLRPMLLHGYKMWLVVICNNYVLISVAVLLLKMCRRINNKPKHPTETTTSTFQELVVSRSHPKQY